MVAEKMGDLEEQDKALKTKRSKGDRYAFHQCFHGDAWLGVMDLSGLATGIYWKIILRMYIKRGAMHDDDADMARVCNESLKNYRRAKAELVAAGRIVVDAENGILYDERAIRELEAANRLSEAQTERAKQRWADKPRTRSKPRMVVNNDATNGASRVEVRDEVGANSDTKSISTSAPIVESIEKSLCRSDANHIQNHIEERAHPETPAPRAALPPLRGGGAQPRQEVDRETWLADQRRRLLADEEGFDETEPISATPGDRTARRGE